MMSSRSMALALMREIGASRSVITHSDRVEKVANSIAERMTANGVKVDADMVRLGALLHDIGRSRSHGLDHGIVGGRIIREHPALDFLDRESREALARICERHIGAGIPSDEAVRHGLPEGDFSPHTLEEKIVAHADNMVWDKILTPEQSRRAFEEEFGRDSPIVRRIVDLAHEVEGLAGSHVETDHRIGEDLQKRSRC